MLEIRQSCDCTCEEYGSILLKTTKAILIIKTDNNWVLYDQDIMSKHPVRCGRCGGDIFLQFEQVYE